MENNIETEIKKSRFKEFLSNGWDLIKFAIVAFIIVLPIRMWIAQPFVVSGESMFPTFNNGDYLIVDEISYILGTAERGDVAVFKYPDDPKRYFIKRIIGLPNETIRIQNNKVTIINKENPAGFVLDEPYINELNFSGSEYTTLENEFFVLGDNRNRSLDSRSWGILEEKFLIGKIFLRLLPLNNINYTPGKYNY